MGGTLHLQQVYRMCTRSTCRCKVPPQIVEEALFTNVMKLTPGREVMQVHILFFDISSNKDIIFFIYSPVK
jgi:hypothetical protein